MEEEWKIVVLEHDEASRQIGNLVKDLWPETIDIKKVNLHMFSPKVEARKTIRELVKGENKRILTIYGSGFQHHHTYALCTEVADKKSDEYAYIHIDKHADSRKRGLKDRIEIYLQGITTTVKEPKTKPIPFILNLFRPKLNCESFVYDIFKDSNAAALRYVGCDMGYALKYDGCEIDRMSKYVDNFRYIGTLKNLNENDIKRVLGNTPHDVYISMDLDVLDSSAITTDCGNGDLPLDELLRFLEIVKNEKNILSVDVLGYCTKKKKDTKSLLTYAKIAGKIIGKEYDDDQILSKIVS